MGAKFSRQQTRLGKVDHKTVASPPRKGEITAARVVGVYDGDTWTVLYEVTKNVPCKIAVRAKDIDTPEMRTKNYLEKEAAIHARDEVSRLILDKTVLLEIHGWDKFGGRILGTIHLEGGGTLNQRIIDHGIGRPYTGKKKQAWTDAELWAIKQAELKLD